MSRQLHKNEENLEKLMRAWNEGKPSLIDEIFSEDFVAHFLLSWESDRITREVYKDYLKQTCHGYPDYHISLDQRFIYEGLVGGATTHTGTLERELTGVDVEPNGQEIEFRGLFMFRVEDDEFVEEWYSGDYQTLFLQLDERV